MRRPVMYGSNEPDPGDFYKIVEPESDIIEPRVVLTGRQAGFYAYKLAQAEAMETLATKPELAEWLGETTIGHEMSSARWN